MVVYRWVSLLAYHSVSLQGTIATWQSPTTLQSSGRPPRSSLARGDEILRAGFRYRSTPAY